MNIVFSWNELPAYGAKLLNAGINQLGLKVSIVATVPQVPIKGMEKIVNQKIYWIKPNKIIKWSDLGLQAPDIFFQAGTYYIKSFKNLGQQAKNKGGKVILLSDNCYKKNIRQVVGMILFRMIFQRWFDAVWVPGKSGKKLMRAYGFSKNQIYEGLYGVDNNCFKAGKPLNKRPKQFIYVGNFIYLKGVQTLVEAFREFNTCYPEWKILVFGIGPYAKILKTCPGATVKSFSQPSEISKKMRESRFLIQPSIVDHWPLVVPEAALSGCGLILSSSVGNRIEFLNHKNGFTFQVKSSKKLARCLKRAANLDDQKLGEVYNESLRLGSYFTPKNWANNFCKIINDCKKNNI